MKVICAGLPKTGTKTLAAALRVLGLTVYDAPESILYHMQEWHSIMEGKQTSETFKKMYENVDAVTDVPACGMWDHILDAFPDSKVILLIRDENDWYKSFQNQMSLIPMVMQKGWIPNYFALMVFSRIVSPVWAYNIWKMSRYSLEMIFGFYPHCKLENEMLARSAFRKHNLYVMSVCPKRQLLVFSVKEGWKPLCDFLGKPVPDEPFPHLNKDGEIVRNTLGSQTLETITAISKAEMKGRVLKALLIALLIVVAVIAAWLFQ